MAVFKSFLVSDCVLDSEPKLAKTCLKSSLIYAGETLVKLCKLKQT